MTDLTFNQWLLIEETAFATQRFNNMRQDMDSRVKFGKSAEQKILNSLRQQYGWSITPASSSQDMYSKIDGIVTKADPKVKVPMPAPIQVKYRDSGDDILMEVTWKLTEPMPDRIDNLLTGRDMVGKSALYACANREGTLIRVRSAVEAKLIAKRLLESLISSRQKVFQDGANQIRIVNDPRDQRKKINAFIHPDSFEWKADYPVKSIWEEEEPAASGPSQVLPQGLTPSMVQTVATALTQGHSTMPAPNNLKKLKPLEQFAKSRGINVKVAGNQLVFTKAA